ncbi:MAG TPA: hypothetical protein VEA38_02185 [Terriglobales bacterium]|nr:hypothetical protein [Terriglobales bacterium]
MVGNECPECGMRLTGRKCRCGWTAEPDESVMPTRQSCARCGSKSPSTTEFYPDPDDGAATQDRGVRLCPACWIPALRRRAELDPASPEQRAVCMAKIRGYAARIAERVVTPRRVEAVQLTGAEGGGHP